jgi:hypothetical protein
VSSSDDELADYTDLTERIRPARTANKPVRGKRLGLIAAGAAVLWAGIAGVTSTKAGHRTPSMAEPPSSNPPALEAPLLTGRTEYLWADQPATPSYRPAYGLSYDTAQGFGPADAFITRNQPGDYTIHFPNFGAAGTITRNQPGDSTIQFPNFAADDTVTVRAYDSASACYTQDSQATGVDETVRVVCLNIGVSAPSDHIGPLPEASTDSRFTVVISKPTRPPSPTTPDK